MQSEILLYRHPTNALVGTVNGANWQWPGTALSASTSPFYGDKLNHSLCYARWVLVWNPSTGISPTGVRLVLCDSGPTNLVEMCEIRQTYYNSPRVDAVDVTAKLNELITNKQFKQIGQQTFGNGGNGCLIYASWLELVWE